MKTILTFENGCGSFGSTERILRRIRELYPSEPLILISAGDYLADGCPMPRRSDLRSEGQLAAGADLVLSLPSASTLGGFGKKDFASCALIQRLHSDGRVLLPFRPLPGRKEEECIAMLRSLAMLIFREQGDYKSVLAENLKKKMPFREARQNAVCHCMPEAAALTAIEENRFTVSILDAMLQLYYMVPIEFINVSDLRPEPEAKAEEPSGGQELFGRKAADAFRRVLFSSPRHGMMEISGSTAQMTDALYGGRGEIEKASSLQEIVEFLLPCAPGPDMARLFLMKAILGLRHSTMQICGLHVYAPYCHMLGVNPEKQEFLRQLEAVSWVPFVGREYPERKLPEDFRLLYKADRISSELMAPV